MAATFPNITLRNFDHGIVHTLGAQQESDNYYLRLPSIIDPITVLMAAPEDVFENYILPSVVLRRDTIELDLQRFSGYIIGWHQQISNTRAIEKHAAWPFNITYDIQVFARYKTEALHIFHYIMGRIVPFHYIRVVDSQGNECTYDAIVEGFSVLDEIADVADRIAGFSMSLRVIGEIDLTAEFEQATIDSSKQLTDVVNLNMINLGT